MIVLGLLAGAVAAQQHGSGVKVDLSVLDELGPPKPVRPADRVTLRPPEGVTASTPAKPQAAPAQPPAPAPAQPPATPSGVAAVPAFPAMRGAVAPVEEVPAQPVTQPAPAEAPIAAEPPSPATGETAVSADAPAAAATPAEPPSAEPTVAQRPAEEALPDPASAADNRVEASSAEAPREAAPVAQEQPATAITEDAADAQPPPVAEDIKPEVTPAPTVPVEATPIPAVEQASRPPVTDASGAPMRFTFAPGSSVLGDDAEEALNQLVQRMEDDPELRITVLGYADAAGTEELKARRLSLSRALAVRLYLRNEGIAPTRALIQALGGAAQDGPADRVDIVVASP